MQKLTKLLALLVVLALFAVACGDDDNDSAEETDDAAAETTDEVVEDDAPVDEDDMAEDDTADDDMADDDMADDDMADEEMPVLETPERIVSINPSGTEIIYALGVGDNVVAVDSFSYFPEGTPVTDLSAFTPNTEAILAFEPDLVVMGVFAPDVTDGLEAAGVQVLLTDSPNSFDELYDEIIVFGEVLGAPEAAAEIVAEMQSEIADIVADAPSGEGISYFHELDNTLFSVTSNTFIGAVYSLFGLTNVADPADEAGGGFPQLSDEYLIDTNPDLIFLADTICCAQSAATVAERPGWAELSAVQNGNVIELNDDIVSRWGPRIVEFVESIALALEGVAVSG